MSLRPADVLGLSLLGGAMLAWTWGTWPDPLFDFGRELYVPWRLTEGEVLYRDIAWFNGPLSPYLNAAVFRVLGVGLSSLVAANVAVGAAVAALLVRLFGEASGRVGAVAAGAVFLTVFATIQLVEVGNYNFVTPYSHEMTHGLLLALLSLEGLRRFAAGGRGLAGSGFALGLLALTKAELLVAGGGAALLWTALLLADPGSRERTRRALPGAAAAALAPPLAAFALLAAAMPAGEALRGVLGAWVHLFDPRLSGMPFYAAGMGLDDPAGNLLRLLRAAGAWALVLAAVAVGARLLPAGPKGPEDAGPLGGDPSHGAGDDPAAAGRSDRGRVLALLVFAAVFAALFEGVPPNAWAEVARPLPLAMLGLAAAWAARLRALGPRDPRARVALVLTVFSGLLLLKVVLYARLHHYGFVLALPASLVVVVALLEWAPASGRVGSPRVFRAGAAGALAAAVAGVLLAASFHIGGKTVTLGEGRDAFLVHPRRAVLAPALAELRARSEPGDTLVVLPEGVMLNYLLRAPNPTPFVNAMPPETVMFGEEAMLAALRDDPPSRVVFAPKSTLEYGLGEFGQGYAVPLLDWVRSAYPRAEPVADEHYGVWILERP